MSENPAASLPGQTRRPDNLALAFQEILTVIERLRSNRQPIPDAATFRYQFREALKLADAEARKRGYTAEDIQLAIFAVVAFLDESILNLRSPIFADWPRRPLQEELFGHHIAGEIFFKNLQDLLGRSDSQELADLLEVYYLCLLLGFAGRYSLGGQGDLRGLSDAAADKIRRIRGGAGLLSPTGGLPAEGRRQAGSDPWVKKLIIAASAAGLLALILFVSYWVILGMGISSVGELVGSGRL